MQNIEKIVFDRFTERDIVHISSELAEDRDGEPILVVDIIHRDSLHITPELSVGLTDALWDHLAGSGQHAFPVITFRSQHDSSELDAA
ncbi:MAG: hypothetical protein AAFY38_15395 [Pseudomonadota bacterium]